MGDIVMSSIMGGMSQISDLQSQIWQMYNKINNATIDAGQKHLSEGIDENVASEDFVKALEEQFQKQTQQVLDKEVNLLQSEQMGMPAGMNISEVGEADVSYQSLIDSLMESMMNNLDKNSDGHVSQDEMKNLEKAISQTPDIETTGSIAFSNSATNKASNFIQKLIDTYKDKGSINGINV